MVINPSTTPDTYYLRACYDQATFQPLGEWPTLDDKKTWIEEHGIPSPPDHYIRTRTLITTLAITGIVIFALLHTGHLASFPQDFVHAATSLNGIIALSTFGACVLGGAIIIHRICAKSDTGNFTGEEQYQPIYMASKNPTSPAFAQMWEGQLASHRAAGYVDNSAKVTLIGPDNRTPKEYRPIYTKKFATEHETIAIHVLIATAVHAAAAMVWNALRIVFKPLQILVMGIYEKATNVTDENRQYHFKHIPIEFVRSIWNVFKAPFYMTAMMVAALYALVNPINGRKLGYLVEQEWGGGKMHHESVWIADCMGGCATGGFWKDVWRKIKKGTTFEVPGCWRPVGYVHVDTGTNQADEVISFRYRINDNGGSQRTDNLHLFIRGFKALDAQPTA